MEDVYFCSLIWFMIVLIILVGWRMSYGILRAKIRGLDNLVVSYLSSFKAFEELNESKDKYITELKSLIVALNEYIELEKQLASAREEFKTVTESVVRKPADVTIMKNVDGKTWDIVEDWGGIIAQGFHKAKEAMDYAKNQGWLTKRKTASK